MSNAAAEKQAIEPEIEAQRNMSQREYEIDQKVDYNRAGAIDAEKLEHDMTVLQTARAYPAATWWAFVMSCTIVSLILNLPALSFL